MTNAICQRHSLRLVETVNNEYFLLDGEVNDTKHGNDNSFIIFRYVIQFIGIYLSDVLSSFLVIPKDLMKLCRAGCPSKIKEFCQEWIRLKNEGKLFILKYIFSFNFIIFNTLGLT